MISRSRSHARIAAAVLVAAVGACHRAAPTPDPRRSADCRAALAREADARIHIDGPGMNTPRRGDSLVIVVNDHEAWRGVYDPCRPARGRSAALEHVIPATDSVVSVTFLYGPAVSAKYHIGGKGPAAYVIRTAPPPE